MVAEFQLRKCALGGSPIFSLIALIPKIHLCNQRWNDTLIVGLAKLKARKPDIIVPKKFT
jgi:hypothetical protein